MFSFLGSSYKSLTKISLVLLYLLILAGGVVRCTGSGMGCPDWPKCFGKWIPPIYITDLPADYKELYAHRGYDKIDFNAFNTWTEYINRLLGLVGGLLCFILFLSSLFTRSIKLILLSLLLLLLMAFQAWIGALVVYSILSPFKITIHMLVALFILCILFFLSRVSSLNANTIKVYNPWIWIALIISLCIAFMYLCIFLVFVISICSIFTVICIVPVICIIYLFYNLFYNP